MEDKTQAAEPALAFAAFAQKEVDLKVQRARIDAQLAAIEAEKEKEAAFAEAAALEEALEGDDYLPRLREPKAPPPPQRKQPDEVTGYTEQTTKVSLREQLVKEEEETSSRPAERPTVIHHDLSFPSSSPKKTVSRTRHEYRHSPNINADTAVDRPYDHGGFSDLSATADLAKFLARSQLITTGLTKFDDKVKNYWAWKSSFSNAIEGLDLTEAEELDLLVKWLGRESSEHVRRIKSVHIRHPAAGLKMAWDRLEQCYGTPEAIESALFARLENFPKIPHRDVQKLRDLADLLLEIEAAKEDHFLPGLSYLDTARGIHPILEKLPYHLQDKWTSYGSKYKEQYQVSFPPFVVFSKFIYDEAKARNDPSFILRSSSHTPSRREHPDEGYSQMKQRVSVHRTQISPPNRESNQSQQNQLLTYLRTVPSI